MRITTIHTRQVDVEMPVPFHATWAATETRIRLCHLRIEIDTGIDGVAGHEFFGAEEQVVRRIATYLDIRRRHRCAVVCDAILEAARSGRRVVVGS